MTKRTRSIPALGAVFFAVVGLSACGAAFPATRSCRSAAADHQDHVRTLDGSGRRLERHDGDGSQAGAARTARTTRPASRTSKRPRPSRPKARRRRPTASLKPVRTAVQVAAAGGARLPDLLRRGCSAKPHIAGREGQRQGSPERSSKKSRPSSSQSRRNSKNSSRLSGQTVSDLLLRVKLNLLSQKIQQKIVKGKATPTKAQIEKYYNEHKSTVRHAGKAQRRDHPHQGPKRQAKQGQEGNRIGQELRERRQKPSRSTRRARPTAAC